MRLPATADLLAPDGSEVRVLLSFAAGGMAHFSLAATQVSRAVRHRSVEEIWYVLSGAGEMWRSHGGHEEVLALCPGLCLTIPVGVRFQFRAADAGPLAVVAITMPPWPGDGEAEAVAGTWAATVGG
ncbi:cupin domain-containing protein [Rhodopila sp.]|uniref:cupin domain-containing protein n=1 Tax=Rhodopila sp. TaxID=2480087 RepID=UPI003D0A8C21